MEVANRKREGPGAAVTNNNEGIKVPQAGNSSSVHWTKLPTKRSIMQAIPAKEDCRQNGASALFEAHVKASPKAVSRASKLRDAQIKYELDFICYSSGQTIYRIFFRKMKIHDISSAPWLSEGSEQCAQRPAELPILHVLSQTGQTLPALMQLLGGSAVPYSSLKISWG